MFDSGAERDRINTIVLVIISSKSDNGLDGSLYTRITIRSGLRIITMSTVIPHVQSAPVNNLHTAFQR